MNIFSFDLTTSVEENSPKIIPPAQIELYQNYPNPFNPMTTIYYQVPEVKGDFPKVTLVIYDILGRIIRTLVNESKEAGYYSVQWDGKNGYGSGVASGVYFYQMKSRKFIETRKMVMLK